MKLHTEKDQYIETFSKSLKTLRKQRFKNQEQFSEAMGVTIDSVRKWESGVVFPEVPRLCKIAEVLECDIDYLLGRIEQKTHCNKFIQEHTGLSEQAIEKLKRIATSDRITNDSKTLSYMIEDESFQYLLRLMSETETGKIDYPIGEIHFHPETQAVIRFETNSTFSKISDHVREKMKAVQNDTYGARVLYEFAYSLYAEGKLTDDQYNEIIKHFDEGDFEYSPKRHK